MTRSLGVIALCIYLLLVALFGLTNLAVTVPFVLPIVACIAGVLLLLGK